MRRFCRLPAVRWLAFAGALAALPALLAPVMAHVALDRQKDATLYLRRGEIHRGLSDWGAAAADYRGAR